jgi:transposase-like protein
MSENYTPEFKARIVLQALQARETDSSIAQAFGVHPVTLSRWKTQFERNAPNLFGGGDQTDDGPADEIAELNARVERLETENRVLRDVFEEVADIDKKVALVNAHKDEIGLNAACEIVDLPKSTYYYRMTND